MIHSYSKIKTDRNYNEDFKTYATLGVLQYLPAQFFWQLLRGAVINNKDLPIHAGEILQIDFWPKWYKIQNIKVVSNSSYIEPDVFIRFKNFYCIIDQENRFFRAALRPMGESNEGLSKWVSRGEKTYLYCSWRQS